VETTFEEAWERAAVADGWLTAAQGRALFDAAAVLQAGEAAVEIGSHRGRSTIVIASGLGQGRKLTAVDPFDDPRWGGGPDSLDLFLRNLTSAGVADKVDLFKGLSLEAADQWRGLPVGFLWVDGAHDLVSTLQDFDGWMPHMAPGGLIYVHDAFCAVGTTRAILRRFFASRKVEYLGAERSLVKFRVRELSVPEALRSSLGILSRLPFFVRMLAIKVARRRHWNRMVLLLKRWPEEPGI
jgi:predicted O-methyltransferase YrrM